MNPHYIEIFEQRGHPYHAAMQSQPLARNAEFDGLFARHPLRQGESVLDIPAGGRYLARHLAGLARVTSLELTPGFCPDTPVVDTQGLVAFTGHDRAVCLAALHHFEDAPAFMHSLRGTLKPGGMLHIGDVPANSSLCDFLDGFVSRYNVTGHAGNYLPADPAHFAGLGRVLRCEVADCPWRFPSEADMLDFCNALFGLVDCPRRELRNALQELVGFAAHGNGIELRWRLLYVDILNA